MGVFNKNPIHDQGNTAFQANLKLIVFVPLENSSEASLQDRQEDAVGRRWLLGVCTIRAGERRALSLDYQELGLERDVFPEGPHPLRHPP